MPNSFCIKTNNKQVLSYLQSELKKCNLDELYISNNCFKNFRNIIVYYKGKDEKAFYSLICNALQATIKSFYEERIIKNILFSNYFYFSDIERKQILEQCLEMLDESQQDKIYRDKLINSALHKYVEKNKFLILDGFINFRLSEYIKELDEFIDLAVDKFVVEKEYNEFIDLLRSYVCSKDNQTTLIHLIYHNDESILLDEKMHLINISSEIFDGKYLSDISFSSNDYALNALLNLLPEKLFIHIANSQNNEFINTLKQIFENRVVLCYNCPICNLYRNKKERRGEQCSPKKSNY